MLSFLVEGMVMKMKFHTSILFILILSAFAAESIAANPQVTLHVTGAVTGDIVLELYPDKSPVTVSNFLNYTRSGFYDGLIFHRVTKSSSGISVIQGGGEDPRRARSGAGERLSRDDAGLLRQSERRGRRRGRDDGLVASGAEVVGGAAANASQCESKRGG